MKKIKIKIKSKKAPQAACKYCAVLANCAAKNMNLEAMIEAQELARLFNEDEAVWRCYERKRALRRWLASRGLFSEHILDYLDSLDWRAAEQEGRMVRAVGFFLPPRP